MATIPQTRHLISGLLGPRANQLAVSTQFTRRESKLTGSAFVQALVFSSLASPALSYPQLCQGALGAGVAISQQGLAQRFTPYAVDLLGQLVHEAVHQTILSRPLLIPLLQRFHGIAIRDSSVIPLPQALQAVWPGMGGTAGPTAALKLQVRLEYQTGQVGGPMLQPGRVHDQDSPFQDEPLPAGALRLGDLGFFNLDQFAADSQAQVYWLSRYKTGTCLYTEAGQPLDLLAWLQHLPGPQAELAVQVGAQLHLPARLLVSRVPQEVADQRRRKLKEKARKHQTAVSAESWALAAWTILLTNVPPAWLSLREALLLLGVRWQIECLFRVWKGQFLVDEWRSHNPWRILCEVYAKLLGVVLFQWLVQIELWARPDHSLWKAAGVLQRLATSLALAFADAEAFERGVDQVLAGFRQIAHLTRRRAAPGTTQRLLALTAQP